MHLRNAARSGRDARGATSLPRYRRCSTVFRVSRGAMSLYAATLFLVAASRGTCNVSPHTRVGVMMSSRDGSQREGPDDGARESSPRQGPDDDASPWSEAFKQQFSDELLQRLEIFAARRLAGIGRRVTQGHEQQAREIVASVIFQTTRGLVRWHPDRQGLESHFKAAIKRQTSLDWKRSKSICEESLDATDADGYSAVREEVESMLQQRIPDPASTQRAARAVEEIERIAASDPDFAAFFDARADGLRASAVMRRTGLSPAHYRRCRRLLAGALDRVSFDVRPWRRKRESQS
jgi:hypothetical protein